ncbi:hypothetical protein FACS1894111_03780 [Clostridia bacterium]|nr:hypothetical protein FACS1894111_03780 [Clostridia bacterium]
MLKSIRKPIAVILMLLFLILSIQGVAATEVPPPTPQESSLAGIVNTDGTLTLDTRYKQPHKFNIYYGELAYSGIKDYSKYEFLIVSDRNQESVATARGEGCKIFQYLAFGSRFTDTDAWIADFEKEVLGLKNDGLADGIFLDECDVDYWKMGYAKDPDKCQTFYDRLKAVTDFCKANDILTVVNGTRAFCDLGDYYLWESFESSWSSDSITWSDQGDARKVEDSGEISYGKQLSHWTLSGTCSYNGHSISNGANGSAEILLDMDTILPQQERKDSYDWVYLEWFGKGADDNNCKIWIWTGDTLPFDENTWDGTWRKAPQLWKGEPASWDGIGKTSKYLKIRFEFTGAADLQMDSILLKYNYRYPNQDMNRSNGEADTNPFLWNYNNSQRDFLWDKMAIPGSQVKVLTHSYGAANDEYRKRYVALSSAIYGFYANDYVHPMMQQIYENDPGEEPMGMLLRREGDTAYFTGGVAKIDTTEHTYKIKRSEPAYWYKDAVAVDGDTKDWSKSDRLYQHEGASFAAFPQWWGANNQTYVQGSFENTKMENRDGFDVLELIADGSGTWTSPVISGEGTENAKVIMGEVTWDGNGAVYEWKYKRSDGTWNDWIELPKNNKADGANIAKQASESNQASRSNTEGGVGTADAEFTEFQVRVTLKGAASYSTTEAEKDANGNVTGMREVFHQGVSFWGSSHTWQLQLPENIAIKQFRMTDDRTYLYVSFETEGEIDFSHNPNLPSDFNYYVYLDTQGKENLGYIGSWWKSTFGTDYRIGSSGIFKWDDSYVDRSDSDGWQWVGSSGMTYALSADHKQIEYRIRKDHLGGLSAKDIKVYMQVEDSKSAIGNLIAPLEEGKADYAGNFVYTQKVYETRTPHGYYCSEEIKKAWEKDSISLSYDGKTPMGTKVRAWIRTKEGGASWSDWTEVKNGQPIYRAFDTAQYCIGLYTKNGNTTPVVENITVEEGKEAPLIFSVAAVLVVIVVVVGGVGFMIHLVRGGKKP